MADLVVGSLTLELDEDGFLTEPSLWNEEVAKALVLSEEISEFTEEHWKVINYLREYFDDNNVAPMVRKVVKDTGYSLNKIYELFPSGPAKGACKIAGLPKPTGCV